MSAEDPKTLRASRQFELYTTAIDAAVSEIEKRIAIQNNQIQYGLVATAGMVAFMAAILRVFAEDGVRLSWLLICSLAIYGLVLLALLGNWLYQLSHMFRDHIFVVWMKYGAFRDLIDRDADYVLRRWDHRKMDPWIVLMRKRRILARGFLQNGPLYALIGLACFGLLLLGFSAFFGEPVGLMDIGRGVSALGLALLLFLLGTSMRRLQVDLHTETHKVMRHLSEHESGEEADAGDETRADDSAMDDT